MKASSNIWDLQHQFNLREGEKIDEYVFPDRFYDEPLPAKSGIKPPLQRDVINAVLKRYFKAREWVYGQDE